MKGAPAAALVYAALTLAAAGREVDAGGLGRLLAAAGLAVPAADLAAMAHLAAVLAPPGAGAGGAVRGWGQAATGGEGVTALDGDTDPAAEGVSAGCVAVPPGTDGTREAERLATHAAPSGSLSTATWADGTAVGGRRAGPTPPSAGGPGESGGAPGGRRSAAQAADVAVGRGRTKGTAAVAGDGLGGDLALLSADGASAGGGAVPAAGPVVVTGTAASEPGAADGRVDMAAGGGAAAAGCPAPSDPLAAAGPVSPDPVASGEEDALYLYGVVEDPNGVDPVGTGLDGAAVLPVREGMLTLLAHRCRPLPYATEDRNTLLRWATAHAAVLNAALARYPAVAPFAFNTIMRGGDSGARGAVGGWLRANRAELAALLERLRGRHEYAVRARVAVRSPGGATGAGGSDVTPGIAYLLRTGGTGTQAERARAAVRCVARLRALSAEVRVEAMPGGGGAGDVLRASALVAAASASAFLNGVARLRGEDAEEVEVTGPWPPYSFVRETLAAPASGG